VDALRNRLNLFTRQFALALQRATRLRPDGALAAPEAPDPDLLRTSARHLPGAGWIVGLVTAFVFALVALLLRGNLAAPAVAAVACLVAAAILTGGSQESAVFRSAESLHSAAPAGASGHGALALVLLVAGKVVTIAALGAVSEAGVLAALFAAPVLSRFAPLLAAHWRTGGEDADRGTVLTAALWCLVPLLLMVLAHSLAFMLAALVAAAAAWVALLRVYRNRPGNFGEDRAATLQQACELACYLGCVVVA
jgi:adenosylcobinamide-GDP ribazoletransferase